MSTNTNENGQKRKQSVLNDPLQNPDDFDKDSAIEGSRDTSVLRNDQTQNQNQGPKSNSNKRRKSSIDGNGTNVNDNSLVFIPTDTYIQETESLRLPGETVGEDLVASSSTLPSPSDSLNGTSSSSTSTSTSPSGWDQGYKPCRVLDDFVMYDLNHQNGIIGIEEIGHWNETTQRDVEVRVAGLVTPQFVENDEDDDDDEDGEGDGEVERRGEGGKESEKGFRLTTTTIFSYAIHYDGDGASSVWIETQYCWYLLRNPAEIYKKFYIRFYKAVCLASFIIQKSLLNPRTTLSGVKSSLRKYFATFTANKIQDENDTETTQEYRNGCLLAFSPAELTKYNNFIVHEIETFAEENDRMELILSPVYQQLQGITVKTSTKKQYQGVALDRSTAGPNTTQRGPKKITDKEIEARGATVTPLIKYMCDKFDVFKNCTSVVEYQDESGFAMVTSPDGVPKLPELTVENVKSSVTMGTVISNLNQTRYLNNVLVDQKIVSPGSYVCYKVINHLDPTVPDIRSILNPENSKSNDISNFNRRIGLVTHLKLVKNVAIAHVHRLYESSDTFVDRYANESELLLSSECTDIPCTDIFAVMNPNEIKYLPPGVQPSQSQQFWWRYQYTTEGEYLCAQNIYDRMKIVVPSLNDSNGTHQLDEIAIDIGERCINCDIQKSKKIACIPRLITTRPTLHFPDIVNPVTLHPSSLPKYNVDKKHQVIGYSYREKNYYLHDFVYIALKPTREDQVWVIGQITGMMENGKMVAGFNNFSSPGDTELPDDNEELENELDSSSDESDFKQFFKPPSMSFEKNSKSTVTLHIRLFGRWDNLFRLYPSRFTPSDTTDERKLYLTNNYVTVSPTRVTGSCWVLHRDAILDLNSFKEIRHTYWFDQVQMWDDFGSGVTEVEVSGDTDSDTKKGRIGLTTISLFTVNLNSYGNQILNMEYIKTVLYVHLQRLKFERHQNSETRGKGKIRVVEFNSNSNGNGNELDGFGVLRALDLFAGCGGLTVGFDGLGKCVQDGEGEGKENIGGEGEEGGKRRKLSMRLESLVKTVAAVEFNKSASLTFEKNFPNVMVYNQDANMLLSRAIKKFKNNQELDPLVDLRGNRILDLPRPGEIDFIYCGPPCQGFSGLNQYKKTDDKKNAMIVLALSYVAFYQPKLFLLENVVGMVNGCLGGYQAGIHKTVGGVKHGAPKLIISALLAMGYQVRFSVLQAGNQGVPQSRRRFILIASKRHLPLPSFPDVTHLFKSNPVTVNLGVSGKKKFCYVKGAPLPGLTISDGINDLKPFEYVNPNIISPLSPEELEKIYTPNAERYDMNECKPAHVPKGRVNYVVGKNRQEYACEPRNEFQRKLRMGSTQCVNHITRPYTLEITERICRVSKEPGSDHWSLPKELAPWCLQHADSASARHGGWKGLYGRFQPDHHFKTTITDVNPMNKQGTLLHWEQNRVISVRETARAQGFPDTFEFHAYNDNIPELYRHTGNAVPPVLAASLSWSVIVADKERYFSKRNYNGDVMDLNDLVNELEALGVDVTGEKNQGLNDNEEEEESNVSNESRKGKVQLKRMEIEVLVSPVKVKQIVEESVSIVEELDVEKNITVGE